VSERERALFLTLKHTARNGLENERGYLKSSAEAADGQMFKLQMKLGTFPKMKQSSLLQKPSIIHRYPTTTTKSVVK
jgi:hypothetical protein